MVKLSLKLVHFILFVWLYSARVLALDDISVNASLDSSSLSQGWPIKGTLEITHNENQKIDELSATLEGKPFKIALLRQVKISPDSPLLVSIYQFTLPPKNKGTYTLAPISILIQGKKYQTWPLPYDVQGPISVPSAPQGDSQLPTLKLEAYIKGPQELYPGQMTYLVYKYIYQGSIDLSKEVLPMLDAQGVQKIGRNDIKNYAEGNASVFEISQQVQAIKPGEFSWGPSTIEGVIYVEDALGNKQYTTTRLTSEAPVVKLMVKPFPLEGQPASFNGAFGEFTFDVGLVSSSTISVGDPLMLDVSIKGTTTNWDSVRLPELCCQPGFGGFFKFSDLPSTGQLKGDVKHFHVEMNALLPAIKSIPTIQFSFFEPSTSEYKILNSPPISVSVAPIQDISQPITKLNAHDHSFPTDSEWRQIYQKVSPLDTHLYALNYFDLINKIGGTWRILWLIPLSLLALAIQFKWRKYMLSRPFKVKNQNSQELHEEMLKVPQASSQYFHLLRQSLLSSLYEKKEIDHPHVSPEDLPSKGLAAEVKAFLIRVDSLRYTNAQSDQSIYDQTFQEAQNLYQKLQRGK